MSNHERQIEGDCAVRLRGTTAGSIRKLPLILTAHRAQ